MTSRGQGQRHRSAGNGFSRIRRRAATAALALTVVLVLGTMATPSAQAQTLTTLHSFDSTDGAAPIAGLVQATDGYLYGTTTGGGANGVGTVFKISPSGTLTTLYSFCSQSGCADGEDPAAGLVQATDGNLYGTTYGGGTKGYGTVFKITLSGRLTALYSFCSQSGCSDGELPEGPLIQATNGDLYGTTLEGGNSTTCFAFQSCGTVFKITQNGALTTLYRFCSQGGCTDGSNPSAGLVQATDGNFYGTTQWGGTNGDGTVFKIAPSGTLTTLHSFDYADGLNPNGLIEATDGDLYGTTFQGGANNSPTSGTVFRITPIGTLTTLYSFCTQSNCTDGGNPFAGLVQATDGNFYGTTGSGGTNGACLPAGCGTAFRIAASGALTILYNFCSQSGCTDGSAPYAALVQDTKGIFYGTTYSGGTSGACSGENAGCGTAFSLSVGLRPFVETQTTSGRVGSVVKILGTNLIGATSVTFNGTPAVFKVISKTLIGATIPEGATSGKVEVTIPGGTLTSNLPFRVRP